MELMFLKPIPKRAIWGENKVGKYFGYEDFPEDTGQCWCASSRDEGSNIILNGLYANWTLKELLDKHPEIFGGELKEFPWIIGLVAPSDDLSIQVHPDDEYAKRMNINDSGKNEGWYFIDADNNSKIVFGHTAKTMDELKKKIELDEWDELLLHKSVKKDDFVYIPAKTIHALCKNTIVYEIQQNSNLTYRLYDYKRQDSNGNQRELHMQEALENLNLPFSDDQCKEIILEDNKNKIKKIVSNDSFELTLFKITDDCEFIFNKPFAILSILEGNGYINNQKVTLGDNLLVPFDTKKISFSGNLTVILCNEI